MKAPVVAIDPAKESAAARWWLPFALTVIAYLAVAAATSPLLQPPGYASPLFPASGIALACTLIHGRRGLAAIALSAFLFMTVLLLARGQHDARALLAALAFAAGATLQALVGSRLIDRFVPQPVTLTVPGDVARFIATCTASSVVSASIATLVFCLTDLVPTSTAFFAWGTWWIGDLAGLLIATPVVLALIGRPASEWVPRRIPVGITLALVTAFLGLGIFQIDRWNSERLHASFDHDASNASLIFATQLEEPLRALEALHGVFDVTRQLTRDQFDRATQNWIGGGNLRSMGWAERVRRDDVAGFEARARADGSTGFRVFDRIVSASGAASSVPESDVAASSPGSTGDVIAVRHIEPRQSQLATQGMNVLSIPAARAAILSAIDTARPSATTALLFSDSGTTGVIIYQAVYDGPVASLADREHSLRGLVFVTIEMQSLVDAVDGKVPAYLDLCIVDADHLATRRRLAGRPGCDLTDAAFFQERPLAFAGRQWDVHVSAAPLTAPDARDPDVLAFALVGIVSAAMLGASLLITTGRTLRIESAVRERTAALQAEVGERQGAEAALRASEQRFRNILDNVPIGVLYSDLEGQVIQANPRFCELTGFDEAELAALLPEQLTHAEDAANDVALRDQLVSGEIPMYRRHKRYVTKAGEVIWARATVTLLRDPANRPWRIVGVVEDITEHLRLEEAEHAREAAEASNRAKSDFLSRMSHELRTPLNAMLGFAQLLEIDQRHPLAPSQLPWVGQIQQAGWHLLDMINDVLDLSRIESGNMRLHVTTLDLPELVAATVALVGSDALGRGIRISQDLAPGTAGILGDATRVKQILTNLLSNAVKYNADAGRIHVASRLTSHDGVEISVTDTGIGMSEEQMAELFKPFNRLGRERSALQGTGIGLVISRRLAELMGGSIDVKSFPGEGTSFMLRLPKAVDPDTVRDELAAFDALHADYHLRTVHYVEDNETNVEVMRGILAQRPQILLEVSLAGFDGLAAIRAQRPHLVLLDMHLPDIDGLELLRQLKEDPLTASIPVLVVSADALAPQIDAAMAAGAVGYVTKPVDVVALLGAVDELLDRMDTAFD